MRTALITLAVTGTEPAGPDQYEDTKKKKAVGHKKVVVKISYAQKCGTGKKADYSGQHQQPAENTRKIANVIDNIVEFHDN